MDGNFWRDMDLYKHANGYIYNDIHIYSDRNTQRHAYADVHLRQ
jgi:hypothetical protein